jgi:hypothetical protein
LKLTPHISINFPLLPEASSLPEIGIRSVKGSSVNINIQREEIVPGLKKCAYSFNYNVQFSYANTGTGNKRSMLFYALQDNNDYKNNSLALRNAGVNILSSTTLSKASFELPSLATGVYFVRVKNKVSGEATNLRYVKI